MIEAFSSRGWKCAQFLLRPSASAKRKRRSSCRTTTPLEPREVLRGLHYQLQPEPQGKLVRCVPPAEIFDVARDIRGKLGPLSGSGLVSA